MERERKILVLNEQIDGKKKTDLCISKKLAVLSILCNVDRLENFRRIKKQKKNDSKLHTPKMLTLLGDNLVSVFFFVQCSPIALLTFARPTFKSTIELQMINYKACLSMRHKRVHVDNFNESIGQTFAPHEC